MQRILDISVPIRKGNRGGKDQFNWEEVKGDKYKECYLGYSLNTARPTFNMPRPNAGWYAKKEEGGAVDLAAIKEEEERLMAEALGLAPRRSHVPQKPLEKADLDNLTKRGATERGNFDDGERVEGVGFRPSYSHETVGGVITSVETKLEGNGEAGWLEKGIQATPARQDLRTMERRPAAAQGEWVERDAHGRSQGSEKREKKEKKDKSDKKRKEKKEKKDKHHKKEKSRRRSPSPAPRRSPSPAPRRRSPSPAPRRRSPSPPPRRRTPSPAPEHSRDRRRSRSPPRRRSRSPERRDRPRDGERSTATTQRRIIRSRSPERRV